MTNKTVIDLMEEYVRVAKMCDAYNKEHGTDIKPWECVKIFDAFKNHPSFTHKPEEYKFAIAILEGRPVFVGDELWWSSTNSFVVVEDSETFRQARKPFWSWTPPTKKRTFILNGEELPCPLKEESDFCIDLWNAKYYFPNCDEMIKVARALDSLLTAARDKE